MIELNMVSEVTEAQEKNANLFRESFLVENDSLICNMQSTECLSRHKVKSYICQVELPAMLET